MGILSPGLSSCVILGRLLDFSECQFSHPRRGDNVILALWAGVRIK